MRDFVPWIVMIVSVVVASLAGFLALGTFMRAQSICPDGFDCADARDASLLFFIVTVASAAVIAVVWRWLSARAERVDGR